MFVKQLKMWLTWLVCEASNTAEKLSGQDPRLPEYTTNNIYEQPMIKLEPYESKKVSSMLDENDPNNTFVVVSTWVCIIKWCSAEYRQYLECTVCKIVEWNN